MARGDSKASAAYNQNAYNGAYNHSTDTIAWSLVSNTYASIDVNAASLALADLTIIASAGNYVAGTAWAGKTWAKSGATSTLDGDNITVAADAANPVTACCIAFYNDTSATDDVICVVDITTDGTTPVDLTNGFTDTIAGLIQVTANA